MVNKTLTPAASHFGTVNGYFINFAFPKRRAASTNPLTGQKSLRRMPLAILYFGAQTARFGPKLNLW